MIRTKWLLVLLLSCKLAFTATVFTCESRAFQSSLALGSDLANSYEDRVNALKQAASECPSSTSVYILLGKTFATHGSFYESARWTERGLQNSPESPDLLSNKAIALLGIGRFREAIATLSKLAPNGTNEFYLGMAYRSLGDHRSAREAFLKAYELGQKQPYVLYEVVREDYSLADKQSGLRDFEILDEQFPDSLFVHILLGDAYLAQHQDEDAEREYREALKRDATVPILYTKLGFVEFRRAEYSEAVDLFRKTIRLDANFAQPYLYLGLCLRRLGKNTDAISMFANAIARDPNRVTAYSEEASAEIEEGKRDDARRVLQTAVIRFPSDAPLHAKLASLLSTLGHPQEARIEAQRAHTLMDHNTGASAASLTSDITAQIPIDDANGWRRLVNEEGAPPNLDAADNSSAHKHSNILEHQAELLRLSKNYKEGLAVIASALKEDPNDPRLFLTQGGIYQETGDQKAAIQSFLNAEQAGDKSAAPLYLIGLSFFILGQHDGLEEYYDRASRHFELAIQADPSCSRAVFMLGVIRAVRSDLTGAKQDFEAALQSSPANEYYHLYYGVLLHRMQNDQGAIKEMQAAEALNPSNARIHLQLGKVYSQLSHLTDARAELETATRLNSQSRAAYYALGLVYRRLGLQEPSDQAFQKFRSLAAEDEAIDDPAAGVLAKSDVPQTIEAVSTHP